MSKGFLRRKVLKTLLFLLVGSATYCMGMKNIYATGEGRMLTPSDANRPLFFTIQLEKREYRMKEPIILKGKLENQGKVPLLVNKQFFLKGSEVEPGGWGIALKVITPSGEQLRMAWLYEMAGPTPQWFIRLAPGESYSSALVGDIAPYCKEGGLYHITAYYYNFIGKSLGLDPWIGVIESNVLEVRITR